MKACIVGLLLCDLWQQLFIQTILRVELILLMIQVH